METLQFFDSGQMAPIYCLSLLWLGIVAKLCPSCWKAGRENGWQKARPDIVFTVILASLLAFLFGAAAVFWQWLSSRQSYYAISFNRDYVVLRFDWPIDDVVLSIGEVHSASYADKWFGRRHRGKLTIESTRGTHETSWGRNRAALEEAAKEITKLKREVRERRAPLDQPDSTVNLLPPAKWVAIWRTLGWIAWGSGLAAFVGSSLFLIRISPGGGLGRPPGHTFIAFAVFTLVALALTLLTPVSKLHLFWFLPTTFGVSLYLAFRISARRRGKNQEIAH